MIVVFATAALMVLPLAVAVRRHPKPDESPEPVELVAQTMEKRFRRVAPLACLACSAISLAGIGVALQFCNAVFGCFLAAAGFIGAVYWFLAPWMGADDIVKGFNSGLSKIGICYAVLGVITAYLGFDGDLNVCLSTQGTDQMGEFVRVVIPYLFVLQLGFGSLSGFSNSFADGLTKVPVFVLASMYASVVHTVIGPHVAQPMLTVSFGGALFLLTHFGCEHYSRSLKRDMQGIQITGEAGVPHPRSVLSPPIATPAPTCPAGPLPSISTASSASEATTATTSITTAAVNAMSPSST